MKVEPNLSEQLSELPAALANLRLFSLVANCSDVTAVRRLAPNSRSANMSGRIFTDSDVCLTKEAPD